MKISKKQVEELRQALINNLIEFLDCNENFLMSRDELFEEYFPDVDMEDSFEIWDMIPEKSSEEIAKFAYPKYLKGTNKKKKK